MGIDTNLITKTTKDFASDFICSVCTDLVELPVTLVKCQHSFCRDCLNGVIGRSQNTEITMNSSPVYPSLIQRLKHKHEEKVNCPDCRNAFLPSSDTVEPYRIMKQVMSRIQLTCPYTGCETIVGYDNFRQSCKIAYPSVSRKMVKTNENFVKS